MHEVLSTNHLKPVTEATTASKDVHHFAVLGTSLRDKVWVSEAVTHVIAPVVCVREDDTSGYADEEESLMQTVHQST